MWGGWNWEGMSFLQYILDSEVHHHDMVLVCHITYYAINRTHHFTPFEDWKEPVYFLPRICAEISSWRTFLFQEQPIYADIQVMVSLLFNKSFDKIFKPVDVKKEGNFFLRKSFLDICFQFPLLNL